MIKFTLTHPKLFHYRAQVLIVVDGDTITALTDRGKKDYDVDTYRINGIDTPELRSSNQHERTLAQRAKARMESLILGKEVILRTYKPGSRKESEDQYGRWLADVEFPEGDGWRSAAEILLTEGLARAYSGEKRRPWFDEAGNRIP